MHVTGFVSLQLLLLGVRCLMDESLTCCTMLATCNTLTLLLRMPSRECSYAMLQRKHATSAFFPDASMVQLSGMHVGMVLLQQPYGFHCAVIVIHECAQQLLSA